MEKIARRHSPRLRRTVLSTVAWNALIRNEQGASATS
jgi:hypothetical protein